MVWTKNQIFEEAGTTPSWRTLGLAGAGRGAGTTHLTVWLANWLVSACKEPAAVLEWNGHGDFERMRKFCDAGTNPGNNWELLGVDYYSEAGSRELADCISREYRRILIDYGSWSDLADPEWARCDRKILVGSLSEWQAEDFMKLLEKQNRMDKSKSFGVVFGSEEARTAAEKAFHTTIRRIPFSADAFAVTGADMEFFRTWNVLI